MRVLCFIDYYLPGYKAGGPINSIANMVEAIKVDTNFLLMTRDHDLNDHEKFSTIVSNAWNTVEGASVYYFSENKLNFFGIIHALKKISCDVIYLNSFFSPHFTIIPLLIFKLTGIAKKIPIIIATHGEFSSSALRIKKIKKKLYLTVFKFLNFDRGLFWHASTKLEANDIIKIFPKSIESICVARNILPIESSSIPDMELTVRKPGCLRLIFLSRISKMKNLEYLLNILLRVRHPLSLTIFGPIEDINYWNHCLGLVKKLPAWVSVSYEGEVKHEMVMEVYKSFDLFVLPTLGENFGHVIIESLIAGTPVLISVKTPWESDNLGGLTVIPIDNQDAWVNEIECWSQYNARDLQEKRTMATKYVKTHFKSDQSVNEYKNMFKKIILTKNKFAKCSKEHNI